MKVGQIGPTFVVPGKTVNFWRLKSFVSFSTLKMRKSQKKLAPVYAYTPSNARKRDGGGKSAPPPSQIGLRDSSLQTKFLAILVLLTHTSYLSIFLHKPIFGLSKFFLQLLHRNIYTTVSFIIGSPVLPVEERVARSNHHQSTSNIHTHQIVQAN